MSERFPLLGHNLVRMVYLDEGGISHKEPALCVAGVMIHGDYEWRQVESAIDFMIDKYIPEKDRVDFVFHATDIYHGSRYFDRAKWSFETRTQILRDLAAIIELFSLPVIVGGYEKESYYFSELKIDNPELKKSVIQTYAAMDCAWLADHWLAENAPKENAMIVAEDADRVKQMMKEAIRTLRSEQIMLERMNMSKSDQKNFGLPLKRIIDTVHFASKIDSKPLQLADLCAFSINRVMKGKDMDQKVLEIILEHRFWSGKSMAL